MKKEILTAIIYLVFTGLILAQGKEDLSSIKIIYSVYSMSQNNGQIFESIKSSTITPNTLPLNKQDIDNCINNFKENIVAKLENYTPTTIINGQREPSRYQIKLTSPLSDCPNVNEMTFKGNWNYVKNQNNENILIQDIQKIDKENKNPLQFREFVYNILINYKEGDSQPTKLNGNITINVPSKFNIIELTNKDINKELNFGNTKIKLLEIKGNTYKIEMTEEDAFIKILPLNENNLEFSMNMSRNIPLVFYQEFGKKEKLSDDDFLGILKIYDKKDKRLIKLGSVSGTIKKILIYSPLETEARQIEIDLELKN